MSEQKAFFAGLGSGRDDVQVEDTYDAWASPERAKELAATENPFHIEVRFLGGLTTEQQQAFKDAADRWAQVIVGDLLDVTLPDGTVIDDVRIDAAGVFIDGPGRVLGRAGPDDLRPLEAGDEAFLPYTGGMEFDTADIPRMMNEGVWDDVIMHEMGHVLGMLDFVWSLKGLVKDKGMTGSWSFIGKKATREFAKLQDPTTGRSIGQSMAAALGKGDFGSDGDGERLPVPIEDDHGPGTIGSHWRETVFGAEMMTGFINPGTNPLSRVTGGALADLGYTVDLEACDLYELPSPTVLAVMGVLGGARLQEPGILAQGYIERRIPRIGSPAVLGNR
jgi:hypothetical protein